MLFNGVLRNTSRIAKRMTMSSGHPKREAEKVKVKVRLPADVVSSLKM